MTEKTNQTAIVNYTAPRPVNIGDVFYRIERAETLNFYEPCKVCGDKRELTIHGVTFKCPCCNIGKQATSIDRYVVRRYRVYAIADEVSSSDWKASTFHIVRFKLYRKCGRGNGWWGDNNGGHEEIGDGDFARLLNSPYSETMYGRDKTFYDDYKLAVQVADQMNAAELKQLDEFNKTNGTAYVAEFANNVTNDPKSN